MKKVFVLAIALMVIGVAANANVFDPDALVEWNSLDWGGGFSWDVGNLILITDSGSFGWYQPIAVNPGDVLTVTGSWQGNGAANWCEVLLFNDDGRSILDQLDGGPLDSSIISKVDDWGMNGGMPFGGDITDFYYPDGLGTNSVTATGNLMFLALKTGSGGGGTAVQFSDIEVTLVPVPEPGTMMVLAAGLGGLLIRRRR